MTPTKIQLEALKELINIGVGKGASILNMMLNSHIVLQVPSLKVLTSDELITEFSSFGTDKFSIVILKFSGEFKGSADLMFPSETALSLVNALVGENPVGMDFDSIRAGTMCEVGNVVLNGVMGSISNIFSSDFDYSVPEFFEDKVNSLFSNKSIGNNVSIILAKTQFIIEELDVNGDILLFLEIEALLKLIKMIEEL